MRRAACQRFYRAFKCVCRRRSQADRGRRGGGTWRCNRTERSSHDFLPSHAARPAQLPPWPCRRRGVRPSFRTGPGRCRGARRPAHHLGHSSLAFGRVRPRRRLRRARDRGAWRPLRRVEEHRPDARRHRHRQLQALRHLDLCRRQLLQPRRRHADGERGHLGRALRHGARRERHQDRGPRRQARAPVQQERGAGPDLPPHPQVVGHRSRQGRDARLRRFAQRGGAAIPCRPRRRGGAARAGGDRGAASRRSRWGSRSSAPST